MLSTLSDALLSLYKRRSLSVQPTLTNLQHIQQRVSLKKMLSHVTEVLKQDIKGRRNR